MLNLILIRAAVFAATGIKVSVDELKTLLVEEGLTSVEEAIAARAYVDYGDFFDREEFAREEEGFFDDCEGLPNSD